MEYAKLVKITLLSIIKKMADNPDLFVKKPGIDFTRKRKLPFDKVMLYLISMEGSCIRNELFNFFEFNTNTPTASAMIQQRKKLRIKAFSYLFHHFNQAFSKHKRYKGYRLLACDGSPINVVKDPKDEDNFFQRSNGEFNQMHLNALYDLMDRRYQDIQIQPGKKQNEVQAMVAMVDRYKGDKKTIFIGDRGYEAYNLLAHVKQKGMFFLIRVKDTNTGILSGLKLPDKDTFDCTATIKLTRKHTKKEKKNPKLYKRLGSNRTFDYIKKKTGKTYNMTLRVVRIKLTETTYESLITNLSPKDFSSGELKELYNMRWGIETSFRKLKYTIGISRFQSKKVEYICQEIFARTILYNFCELITQSVVIKQTGLKYIYHANYECSVHVCRQFLKWGPDRTPPDVEAIIQKNLTPIRPGRTFPRKVRSQSATGFTYRVS